MTEFFYKEIDRFPVFIEYEIDNYRAVVPIYSENNGIISIENCYCPTEFLETSLNELIPEQLYGNDLTRVLKDNFYKIIQNYILVNGHIVDEVFETFLGIFVLAYYGCCVDINHIILPKEHLCELYMNMYNSHREAIPNNIFMRRK